MVGCVSMFTSGWKTQFKTVEVKHFTQVDGLGLSQDFVNSFYDGLREYAPKAKIAEQVVDEGATVSDADAANSAVIEGKFTGYNKGGFLSSGIVDMEIKLYRRSDHTLIKTITSRGAFKASPFNTDKNVGGFVGGNAAFEIGKALN